MESVVWEPGVLQDLEGLLLSHQQRPLTQFTKEGFQTRSRRVFRIRSEAVSNWRGDQVEGDIADRLGLRRHIDEALSPSASERGAPIMEMVCTWLGRVGVR